MDFTIRFRLYSKGFIRQVAMVARRQLDVFGGKHDKFDGLAEFPRSPGLGHYRGGDTPALA